MKPQLSLFAKILAWFFLNLIVVVSVMALYFAFQPQINLHRIFGEQARNRLRTAGMLIAHDLRQHSRSQWPDVLARHAGIHRVDFFIVLGDGFSYSSTKADLHRKVMKKVRSILQRKPPPGRGMRHFDNAIPPGRRIDERHPPPPPERINFKSHFTIRTKDPTRYWSGIGILSVTPMRHGAPAVLIAASDSITGNGFFFDPLPWMVVTAVVILISVLLWIPMVKNITRPLSRMTRATEEIAKGRFDVSIHEPRSDEIGRLAKAIRHMSARLSAFVYGQKRFLSDVAHELGSPIARIQFGLGALEHRIDKENRQRLTDVMEDVDHLSRLVNELLTFSRAEIKSDSVKLERMALAPVVETAVKREAIPPLGIDVDVDPQIQVVASGELLIRALGNIVRNAVKYAGNAGPISITARKKNGQVEIEIRDSGPGVPTDMLDQLFEPFFRPETSRDRDSGGVGLGLAIVKTCIQTCQGTVSAANSHPKGFVVKITLNG